jgi:hypothetical protein
MKTKLFAAALAAAGVVALPSAAGAQTPYTIPTCATGQHNSTTAPYYCIPDTPPPTGKKKVKRLSLVVTPRKDNALPIKFRAKGKLVKPASVSKKNACKGKVRVVFKKPNGKVVKKKTVTLGSNCKYATSKLKMSKKKLAQKGKLKAVATFLGNSKLKTKKSKVVTVKYKKG